MDNARPQAGRSAQHRSSFLRRFRHALKVRRQRNALKNLDDHALRDIGLSKGQARREAKRKMWDF